MEVEVGNVAQNKGQHERVKGYGAMMVRDHKAANQELMSLAAAQGVQLPASLSAEKQKMVTAMQAMQGKTFDNHYMGMMVTDHQRTIAEFERQANNGNDPRLKAWAAKTLPVLRMHLDSAKAINNALK